MKKLALLAAALMATAAPASATVLSFNTGEAAVSINDFTTFDWASNGSAWLDGFNQTGTPFNIYYQSVAGTLQGGSTQPGQLNSFGVDYEFTVFAQATVTLDTSGPTPIATVSPGQWTVYFDALDGGTTAANSAGLGFQDGLAILGGTFAGVTLTELEGTSFPDISADMNLFTDVTFASADFFDPNDLASTLINSSFRLGVFNGTTARLSDCFDVDGPGGSAPTCVTNSPTSFVVRADASQSITENTEVPEPAAVGLLGLGLLGLGFARRRKTA